MRFSRSEMAHNIFYWIGAVLSGLTVLLLYVQFLVGDDDRKIRDRLADWYVTIADGTWGGLLGFALRSTERFLSYVFGQRIISLRFTVVGGVVSLLLGALIMAELFHVRSQLIKGGPVPSGPDLSPWYVFTLFVTVNASCDLCSLAATRAYLRWSTKKRISPLINLVTLFTIAYVAIGAAISGIGAVQTRGLPDYELSTKLAVLAIVLLTWPVTLFYGMSSIHGSLAAYWFVVLSLLPAAFSTSLVIIIYITSLFAYISRPLTQQLLSRTIEQLATVKTGVLPTIVGALGAASIFIGFFR